MQRKSRRERAYTHSMDRNRDAHTTCRHIYADRYMYTFADFESDSRTGSL